MTIRPSTSLFLSSYFALAAPAFACSCAPTAHGPACSLAATSDVVFLGRVISSNDDGSGSFGQGTLVRFAIEEAFQGLPDGTRTVWIDPGSYTSCYARYRAGQRYLMFAERPPDRSAAGSEIRATWRDSQRRPKPVPQGFNLAHPPTIYRADECSGSRPASHAARDLAWLHSWRAGRATTRIYGRILEHYVEYGFPSHEPPLAGATVTVRSGVGSFTAQTNEQGAYEIVGIPPGRYDFRANLAGYSMPNAPLSISLAPGGCAVVNAGLFTTGRISGTAVATDGGRVAWIQLDLARILPDGRMPPELAAETRTGPHGEFAFQDLSSGDFLLGIHLFDAPTRLRPLPRWYFPGTTDRSAARVIHLRPKERKAGVSLPLPAALPPRDVRLDVRRPDGRTFTGARVWVSLDVDRHAAISLDIDSTGSATVPCLQGVAYEIRAHARLDEGPNRRNGRLFEGKAHLAAGSGPAHVTIVMARANTRQ